MSQEILQELSELLGSDYVITDDAERRYFTMDVYNAREMPLAVIQPGTVEELQQAARIALNNNVALVPRGGGASYTDGYLPTRARSLLVETSRLNRIVEINATDMYVTVEPAVNLGAPQRRLGQRKAPHAFLGTVLRPEGYGRRLHITELGEHGFPATTDCPLNRCFRST